MLEFLLRMEAVNFSVFFDDTSDVSTIRGGGLLLLDAPNALDSIAGLTKVYTGASTALFRFFAENSAAAEVMRDLAENKLHEGPRVGATIMVDVTQLPDENSFKAARDRLVALNRWRQLQTPALVYPETNDTGGIDELDDKRPGVETYMAAPREADQAHGRPMVLSQTTLARRKYGIEKKHHFYDGRRWDHPSASTEFPFHPGQYVANLEEMAEYEDAAPRDLNGKLAYIYLDGNKFGSVARACETADEAGRWSDCVQSNQDSFLNWLLRVRAGAGPQTPWHWSGTSQVNVGGEVPKDRAFRIETLLWGGDEIVLVVPAWCGWWVLGSFFAHYGRLPWRLGGDPPRTHFNAGNRYKLSHGAGIVFCHAKAPIQRIIKLAKHLADGPKALGTNGPLPEAYADYFAYQALESFDHLGAEPDELRKLQLPPCLRTLSPDPLILSGAGMLGVFEPMEQFRQRFPRSRIHRLVRLFQSEAGEGLDRACQMAGEELSRAGAEKPFEDLVRCFGGSATGNAQRGIATWLHIAELWDYTPVPTWTAPPVPGGAPEGN